MGTTENTLTAGPGRTHTHAASAIHNSWSWPTDFAKLYSKEVGTFEFIILLQGQEATSENDFLPG